MSNISQIDKQIVLIVALAQDIQILSNILSKHGYCVYCCCDRNTAVKEIERVFPDLILLDFQLCVREDFCLCQQIKANWRTKDIPIVFTITQNESRERVFDAGGIDYITKPFSDLEIVIKVGDRLNFQLAIAEVYRSHKLLETRVRQRTLQLEKEIQKLQLQLQLLEHRQIGRQQAPPYPNFFDLPES